MIYAGDQWMQLPVRDLYNTQMMAMAIDAARDMYNRAEKKLDDFYDKYGDFISPIQKDMEAYNTIIGGVKDAINNIYARGGDPLRNAQDRAEMMSVIRNVPVGDINRLRQSAETAKEYVKNRGLLESAGKYNRDFNERYLGRNLDEWDTLNGNGVWGYYSPTELESLKKLTEQSFNNRTPHDLTKEEVLSFDGQNYDPNAKYTGFTKKDLRDIADKVAPGLYGTPAMEYYKDLAKQKVVAAGYEPTEANINAQLASDIANSQDEYLVKPIANYDDYYKRASLALKRQAQNLAGKIKQIQQDNAPTTFMDRLQDNMQRNLENKRFGRNSIADTISSFASYWDNMAKSVENKGKLLRKEEYTENEPGYNRSKVVGMGPYARLAYEDSVPKKKTRNIYDQSNNGVYKRYIHERDRWNHYLKTGYYVPSAYDKSPEAQQVRNILRKIQKNPKSITAKENEFLQSFQQKDIMDNYYKANSNSPGYLGKGNQPKGTTTTADLKRRASDYWDSFRAEGLGGVPNKVLSLQFAGLTANDAINDPDLPNKQLSISFGSGYTYAPIRQAAISGSGRFKYNDIHSKFNRWLKSNGNRGIITNLNDVQAAGIPLKNRTGSQLDIMQYPAITKEQFDDFYTKAGGSKLGSKTEVAKKLGLRVKDEKLTYKGKDETLHETDTYYEVPVIRTVDNLGGYNYRDINVMSDVLEFNPGTADKNVINSENQSVLQGMPLDEVVEILSGLE